MTIPIIEHEFQGKKYRFDSTISAPEIIKEIFSDNYKVLEQKVEFRDGDVILDVGANEGMFSVMMAALFPQTRVIALEPVERTFATLKNNIVPYPNIEAYCLGIGGKGEKIRMLNVSKDYSGGSSGMCTFVESDMVKVSCGMISLDDAFELYGIDRCRLLKMDIEGMEYEALYAATVLPRVDYMTAEFHVNRKLDFESRRVDGLINWVGNQVKLLHIDICRMCE